MMKYFVMVVVALRVAAMPGVSFAQTDQGNIAGTARDQSSAFVSGAHVSVKNERTGDERSAVTTDQGRFTIGSLKPSSYTIKIAKDGFSAIEYTAMTLALGQELTLDFELKPAGVQESVTVTGSARRSSI